MTGREDALADYRGVFRFLILRQLFVFHRRNLDVQIDAIEQRAGHAGQVSLDQRRRARAVVQNVSIIAALAGIHCRGQHEAGGKRQRHCSAGNRHFAVLERLAQHVQHMAVEFRQFIQKQHAVVRQADFSRPAASSLRRSGRHPKWCGAERETDASRSVPPGRKASRRPSGSLSFQSPHRNSSEAESSEAGAQALSCRNPEARSERCCARRQPPPPWRASPDTVL